MSDPASKWEKYADKEAKWEKYADKPKPVLRDAPVDAPEATWDESASMGAFSGIPIIGGLADEGIAGAQTGWEAIKRYLGDKNAANGMALGDYYRDQRDNLRAGTEESRAANPKIFGGSELAAGILTPIPGLGKIRAATKLGTAVNIGKVAGLGAVEGFNRSNDADLVNNLKDAAFGAGAGAVGGGVGYGIEGALGKYLPRVASAAKNKAEEWAVKALRPSKKSTQNLMAKDQINELGRDLLDSGAVRFGSGIEGITSRLEQQGAERQSALNEVFKALAEKQAEKGGPYPNIKNIADEIRSAGGDSIERGMNPARAKLFEDAARRLEDTTSAPAFVMGGISGPVKPLDTGLEALRKIRSSVGEQANFENLNNNRGTSAALRDVYGKLTGLTKSEADRVAQQHAPEMVGALRSADKSVALNSMASKMAADRLAGDQANRFLSLTDNLYGGGGGVTGALLGAATGHPIAGAGLGLGATAAISNLARKRGASSTAKLLDWSGDALNWVATNPPVGGIPREMSQQGDWLEFLMGGQRKPSKDESSRYFSGSND